MDQALSNARKQIQRGLQDILGEFKDINQSEEIFSACDQLLKLISAAENAQFLLYKTRLASLHTSRRSHIPDATLEMLALSGFFYYSDGDDKYTNSTPVFKCFFCNLTLETEAKYEDFTKSYVFEIHAMNRPNCLVVQELSTREANKEYSVQLCSYWRHIRLRYMELSHVMEHAASFGFNIESVRIAALRIVIFQNSEPQLIRPGDIIQMIYSLGFEVQEESLAKEVLDPGKLIDHLLTITETLRTKRLEEQSTLQDTLRARTLDSCSAYSGMARSSIRDDSGLGSGMHVLQTLDSAPSLSSNLSPLQEHASLSDMHSTQGYCYHSEALKDDSEKAFTLIPCLHLIRCTTCLASEDLNYSRRCPRCCGRTTGMIATRLNNEAFNTDETEDVNNQAAGTDTTGRNPVQVQVSSDNVQ